MLEKHCSGRRSRADAEFGSERIVVGMRAAIRHLRTSCLSRKDIAEFSGVTPPLVTYYYPDRDALLEAATLPIVKEFADEMCRCLSRTSAPERVLWDAIETIINFRTRDGTLIDAYAQYRESHAFQRSNPLLAIESAVKAFFDSWLKSGRNGTFYASLAQVALLAMCESLSKRSDGSEKFHCQLIYQTVICIIGESLSSGLAISLVERQGERALDADRLCSTKSV